jgi:hypothetical protein
MVHARQALRRFASAVQAGGMSGMRGSIGCRAPAQMLVESRAVRT